MNYSKYNVLMGTVMQVEEQMNVMAKDGWHAMAPPEYIGPTGDPDGVWIVWMEYQEDIGRLADRLQPTASGRYGG